VLGAVACLGASRLRRASLAAAAAHQELFSHDDDDMHDNLAVPAHLKDRAGKALDGMVDKRTEFCSTGIVSQRVGGVRACCDSSCDVCAGDDTCEGYCCKMPILHAAIDCATPFDTHCVIGAKADHGAPAPHIAAEASHVVAGGYQLSPDARLAHATSLAELDDELGTLTLSRRRSYVLHMDPMRYQIGTPAFPLAPQLSYLARRIVIHFGMQVRLRDNRVVLTLGAAVTAARIYCVYVAKTPAGNALEMTAFSNVVDIVAHDDALVTEASAAYLALWQTKIGVVDVKSPLWETHRTFDKSEEQP